MTMQNTNQDMKMDSTHHSREELEVLVKGLSDADILRLQHIAEIYTGNHEMDADDLVNEAVSRALSGERKTCPKNLPIISFLAGVMRSISNGEREKYQRNEQLNEDKWNAIEDLDSSTEKNLAESQAFKEMEEIFEDDEQILLLIFHLQEGGSPTEIQKSEGWSKTQYNTIRRKMRRKWNAHKKQENIS